MPRILDRPSSGPKEPFNGSIKELVSELLEKPNDITHLNNVLDGKHLSSVQVILIIQILKQEIVNIEDMTYILCIIIDGWNILNDIGNSKHIRYLMYRLGMELEDPVLFVLYLKTNAEGFNVLHRLSVLGELELMQELLTRAKTQNKGICKALMTARISDGSNFLHIMCSKELKDVTLFGNILEYLDVSNLKALFGYPRNDQYNVLMTCSRYQPILKFIQILEFLYQKVDSSDIMKWLQIFDQDGNNFIQIIAKYNNSLHIEKLLGSCVRRFIDILFLDSITFSQDQHGGTFLHDLAVRCPKSYIAVLQMKEFDKYFTEKIFLMIGPKGKKMFDLIAGDVKTLKETITVLNTRYGKRILTKILTTGSETGNTLLVQILKRKSIFKMFDIFQWLLENLEPECFKVIFSRSKNRGRSSFIYKNDPERIIQMLLVRIFKRIKKSYFFKNHLLSKRICKMLEIYCKCNRRLKLFDLYKWLSQHLNEKEMKYLLRVKISDDHEDKISFLNFLQWMKLEFQDHFIEFLLIATQIDKNLFFNCLFEEIEVDIYDVLKWLKQEFSTYFLKELLMAKTNQNFTFLHCLLKSKQNDHIDILKLLQFISNLMHKTFLETILLSKDKSGKTFIHDWIVNQPEVLPLLQWLSLTFDKKFMEKLLIVDGRLLSLNGDKDSQGMSDFIRKVFVGNVKKEDSRSDCQMSIRAPLRWTFYEM